MHLEQWSAIVKLLKSLTVQPLNFHK